MATRTVSSFGGNWNSTSAWNEGAVPTAADDVVVNASSGNLTINVDAFCRSIDMLNWTAGRTLTHAAGVTLSIGTSTNKTGNIALRFTTGMNYTLGSATTSQVKFVSTSSTNQTIISGNKTFGHIYFDGGASSSYSLQTHNLVQSSTAAVIYHRAGTFSTNNLNVTTAVYVAETTTAKTLNLGTSTLTAGASNFWAWQVTPDSNLTLNAGTSTIVLTGSNLLFSGGGKTYYNVSATGGGILGFLDENTFNNVTKTSTDTFFNSVRFDNPQTINGTFTVTSVSAIKRTYVVSGVPGTQVTVTAAATNFNWVDFADINAAGASAPWTATLAGDLGNNSNITVTTPTTCTKTSANTNWQGTWTPRYPLPQDTASIGNVGATFTIDAPRLAKYVNFTGFTGNVVFSHPSGVNAAFLTFGDWTWASGMTMTASSNVLTFQGRGAHTITSNGVQMNINVTIDTPTGSYTSADAISVAGKFKITNNSVFTAGGTVWFWYFEMIDGTPTINMGSFGWISTTTQSTTPYWNVAAGTVNSGTSYIALNAAAAVNRTFKGGGKTYYSFYYITSASTGTLIVEGSNTFNGNFEIWDPNGASPTTRTIVFEAGSTQTFNGKVDIHGETSKTIGIASSVAGTTQPTINGGFETNVTGWTRTGYLGGTLTRSTAWSSTGTASGLFSHTGLGPGEWSGFYSTKFPVVEGDFVATSGKLNITSLNNATSRVSIAINFYTAANAYISQAVAHFDQTGIFSPYVVGQVPATATQADVSFSLGGGASTGGGGQFYVDELLPSVHKFRFQKPNGNVGFRYVSMSDMLVDGGATWYSTHGIQGSTRGWVLGEPPPYVEAAEVVFVGESEYAGAGALDLYGVADFLAESDSGGAGVVYVSGGGDFAAESEQAGAGAVLLGGGADLSAESTMEGIGAAILAGMSAMTAETDMAGAGALIFFGSGDLAGESDLSGAGTLWMLSPSTEWDAESLLSGAGTSAVAGSGDLSAEAEADGSGRLLISGEGELVGETDMTGIGALIFLGSGALTAESDATGAGTVLILSPPAALSGETSMLGSGLSILSGGAALSGESEMVGIGAAILAGMSAMTAETNFIGEGNLLFVGSGAFAGESDFLGAGGGIVIGPIVAFGGETDLTGFGLPFLAGGGDLAGESIFDGAGTMFLRGEAALAALSDMTGFGSATIVGGASLSGDSDLSGAGSIFAFGAPVDLSGLSEMLGGGTVSLAGGAALSGESEMVGIGAAILAGMSAMTGETNMAGAGALLFFGSGAFAAESNSLGSGTVGILAVPTQWSGETEQAGAGSLSIVAVPVSYSAESDLLGAGGAVLDGAGAALSGETGWTGTGAAILLGPDVNLDADGTLSGTGTLVFSGGAEFEGVGEFFGFGDLFAAPYHHMVGDMSGDVEEVQAGAILLPVELNGFVVQDEAQGIVYEAISGGEPVLIVLSGTPQNLYDADGIVLDVSESGTSV